MFWIYLRISSSSNFQILGLFKFRNFRSCIRIVFNCLFCLNCKIQSLSGREKCYSDDNFNWKFKRLTFANDQDRLFVCPILGNFWTNFFAQTLRRYAVINKLCALKLFFRHFSRRIGECWNFMQPKWEKPSFIRPNRQPPWCCSAFSLGPLLYHAVFDECLSKYVRLKISLASVCSFGAKTASILLPDLCWTHSSVAFQLN